MTAGRPVGGGFVGLPDLRTLRASQYPLIVVKLGPVFQIERVAVRAGPPMAAIAYRGSFVQYPEPLDAEGELSAAARQLLLAAVQDAVRRFRHRMCIVWSRERCSYVERDGVNESTSLPEGGVVPPSAIRFDVRERLATESPPLASPGAQPRDTHALD